MVYSNVNATVYFGLIDHNQFAHRIKEYAHSDICSYINIIVTIVVLPEFALFLIIHKIGGVNCVKILSAPIIRNTYIH